ncbi:lysozyme [Sphingomonas sp.]|uniref:lysozyme n=1 Tax=Sphingomonas sp. TaxID=28214 RepID=UPI001B187D48|nr:lysozyme [Sphingomonas sp.]MBO9712617.1 lysozyme [Sphingomonas sp.]
MTPKDPGLDLIKEFESCQTDLKNGSFQAYPDPASGGAPWTIGWGTTGKDVKKGVVWTRQQCDDRFASDMAVFAKGVTDQLAGAATSQNQFDALVSFAYNVGIGNLGRSTLLRLHKAGNFAGARAEFAKWNKAKGQVMAGLTRRRAAEAALYAKP